MNEDQTAEEQLPEESPAPTLDGEGVDLKILAELERLNDSLDSRDERDNLRFEESVKSDLADDESLSLYREDLTVLLEQIEAKESAGSMELGPNAELLLTTIAENTAFVPEETTDGISYYADLSIVFLVFGLVPIYVAYRFVKGILGMMNHVI